MGCGSEVLRRGLRDAALSSMGAYEKARALGTACWRLDDDGPAGMVAELNVRVEG